MRKTNPTFAAIGAAVSKAANSLGRLEADGSQARIDAYIHGYDVGREDGTRAIPRREMLIEAVTPILISGGADNDEWTAALAEEIADAVLALSNGSGQPWPTSGS